MAGDSASSSRRPRVPKVRIQAQFLKLHERNCLLEYVGGVGAMQEAVSDVFFPHADPSLCTAEEMNCERQPATECDWVPLLGIKHRPANIVQRQPQTAS